MKKEVRAQSVRDKETVVRAQSVRDKETVVRAQSVRDKETVVRAQRVRDKETVIRAQSVKGTRNQTRIKGQGYQYMQKDKPRSKDRVYDEKNQLQETGYNTSI